MPEIIDVSYACGSQAGFLAGTGVKTIIRYYSRDTGLPEKRLSAQEARSFATAGLRLAVVHGAKHGDHIGSFSQSLGNADAAYARQYGAKDINQPEGSAIYFGVDLDATAGQIHSSIIPYFQGVAAAMTAENGLPTYHVGVYGSGATCDAILTAGLARYSWLAQSTGWRGYKPFLQSNRWSLLQAMPTYVGKISCDPDKSNGEFGDFFLSEAVAASAPTTLTVMARSGLRLRAEPGPGFDIFKLFLLGRKFMQSRAPVIGPW